VESVTDCRVLIGSVGILSISEPIWRPYDKVKSEAMECRIVRLCNRFLTNMKILLKSFCGKFKVEIMQQHVD
jgi:hypothetical protein